MNIRPDAPTALLLVIGTTALALLFLSVPRLRASLAYLPVDTAINNYYGSLEIPTRQIPGLVERAEEAIERYDHYRYRDGLGILNYLRGQDMRSPTLERRPSFEKAIAESEISVSVAPAQPLVWYRIAWIHGLLGGAPDEVIPPLTMSIYTGRVEPTLFTGRLELGYRYLGAMDEETTGLLRDQTLLAWKMQPREVTATIIDKRIDWQRIEFLLEGHDDQALAEMEASLAGLP